MTASVQAGMEPTGHRPLLALRPYSRHDRTLFADVSRPIFTLIRDFYSQAAGQIPIGLGANQSVGVMNRLGLLDDVDLFHIIS